MRLSVNCMTRGPAARVAAMLALFRGVADEIVVAVDDRAGEEVEAALASVADRLLRYPYAEPVDRPLAWIHAQCAGEWVLTVDDDEIPGRALLDFLPALAEARDVTHYWLPRRWVYPTADRYLDARPWRPDYQPRLVLNDPRMLSFTPETHVPVKAIGPSRYLDAPLYHLDTLLNSREAREAKVERYERLHPGKRVAGRPLNEAFYLPERRDPATREVPAEDGALIAAVLAAEPPAPAQSATVRIARREEIDRYWSGGPLRDYEARLALLEDVPPLRAGVLESVDVRVENLGGEVWRWDGDVRLGSRWRQGEHVVDGEHRALPVEVGPGAAEIVPLPLVPPEPGRWTLEVDLVHEHVRWFDRPVRVEVDVEPSRLVAVLDPGSEDGLADLLATLDPDEEPVVLTEQPEAVARRYAGRVATPSGLAGAERLVVSEQLVREGRRRPLLELVRAAQKLGIPIETPAGSPLGRRAIVRRQT
ncbi:MAG TPA: hypothetical protein VFA24_07100 [Gaiellaceae bacterium]|nr:hypothetical protein [Gaiellaceae bacterium]